MSKQITLKQNKVKKEDQKILHQGQDTRRKRERERKKKKREIFQLANHMIINERKEIRENKIIIITHK